MSRRKLNTMTSPMIVKSRGGQTVPVGYRLRRTPTLPPYQTSGVHHHKCYHGSRRKENPCQHRWLCRRTKCLLPTTNHVGADPVLCGPCAQVAGEKRTDKKS